MIGEAIRAARERRGMAQSDLGHATGLAQSQIAHYESGRREPNIANLRKLCEALKVSADQLLGLGSTGYESGFRRGAFEAVQAMKAATLNLRKSVQQRDRTDG